jgi:hypothetical protein
MENLTDQRRTTASSLSAELMLARYLGQDFRGGDLRAAVLGLPLVLDFIALHEEPGTEPSWDRFDPIAYVSVIRDIEDEEAAFLKALLHESRLFFWYLGEHGELDAASADRICAQIELALGTLE